MSTSDLHRHCMPMMDLHTCRQNTTYTHEIRIHIFKRTLRETIDLKILFPCSKPLIYLWSAYSVVVLSKNIKNARIQSAWWLRGGKASRLAWWPEFYPQDPHSGSRDSTSGPLIPIPHYDTFACVQLRALYKCYLKRKSTKSSSIRCTASLWWGWVITSQCMFWPSRVSSLEMLNMLYFLVTQKLYW